MKFTPELIEKLKYYIYLYLDPDTNEVFYVGRGRGNRTFTHLSDELKSNKTKRINEIRKRGKKPKIEILIHGLEDESLATKVEAAVIDLIGVQNLTNKVRGWHSRVHGRMEVPEIIGLYNQKDVKITEPALLIRINRLFRYGMSPVELYDATRGIWKIGPNREKARYAFAVYDGIINEVYVITAWFPAGTTFTKRVQSGWKSTDRWEFIGAMAPSKIRHKYINKSVRKYFPKNDQNPIHYVNI